MYTRTDHLKSVKRLDIYLLYFIRMNVHELHNSFNKIIEILFRLWAISLNDLQYHSAIFDKSISVGKSNSSHLMSTLMAPDKVKLVIDDAEVSDYLVFRHCSNFIAKIAG